ncbi:MAG: PKD domain-containing protein [Bacteroidetes bacterium]|nr:PKD domain-containing protein [Bacteroidota bacterium]
MNRALRSSFCLVLCFLATIAFAQGPTANFTATPLTGCSPLVVQFTNTSTGNATSYQWNLGNGVTSVQQNPSTTFINPGTYTVTLTVTDGTNSNTKTITNYITVVPNPSINFSATDTMDCPPLVTQFINNTSLGATGAGTYNWSFGDGSVSTLATPSHTYSAPGTYNVTLVATNSAGCVSTLQKSGFIQVFTPPTISFTGTPTSYCGTPDLVNFSTLVNGNGPYTYSWDFGDGGTGTGANPAHLYTTSGNYTVTVIVTDLNGCKDTLVKPNYISTGTLTANFSNTPTAGCVNAPIQFSNSSVGATTYFWDFGDGTNSNSASPSHTYALPGTFTVKLVAYNSPCADSITKQITVNAGPNVNFTFSPLQPCPAPINITFNNTSIGATTFAWTFGDGGTSNSTNPSHNYAQNNFFEVTLTGTNAFGCQTTKKDTVKIHTLYANISPYSAAGCAPFSVPFGTYIYGIDPFTNLPYPYPSAINSWNWTFGDGGTSNAIAPTHIYTATNTTLNCTVTVTTTNGCTTSATRQINVGTKPTASFIGFPDTACVKNSVLFTNTSTNTIPTTNYTWSMGDGTNLSSKNALYAYQNSGYYKVSLIASNFGCNDTMSKDSAAYILAPTAKWNVAYNCDTPLRVKFYDTLSINPTGHTWYFGDGTTSTAKNPVHTYSALGIYTVSLVTSNNTFGCIDTLTKTIELVNPQINFSTPTTSICRGDSIVFTPTYTHTPTNFSWQINGAAPNWPFNPWSNPNPSSGAWGYRFNQKGVYTISVSTADIHGCRDTATRTNYVLVAKPTALFTATPTIGCAPLVVLFKDTSTNIPGVYSVTRTWDFGNTIGIVTTDTVSHVYPIPATYQVQLIVTDNIGCKDTLVKTNYIQARKPIAAFTASDSIACIGQTINFTSNSTGISLTNNWYFGDGTTATGNTVSKAYTQTGNYTVKLVVIDASGCMDSLIKSAYIKIQKPTAGFTVSDTQAVCPPLTVVFTNTSLNYLNSLWAFGNGSGATIPNPSTIYSSSGIYPVMLIVTDSKGCSDTATRTIKVLGYTGGFTYQPIYGCAPLLVGFKSKISGVPTMIWDFNDGVTQNLNGSDTASHLYISPGGYLPKIILSDNKGCVNANLGTTTIQVDDVLAGFVHTAPCVNTPITFTDTSFSFFKPISTWFWDFNNGQQTSNINPTTFTFPTNGSFKVTLVATNAGGCKDTVTRTIKVNDLPIVGAAFDTTICKGDETPLSAWGANSYTWSPNNGLACATCQNTLAAPVVTTNYVVTGTDANGCKNSDSVIISVKYITTSHTGLGGGICADSVFQLSAWGADKYSWSPAATLNDNSIANPLASPKTTTTYILQAWEASCLPDTHQVEVVVYPKPVVDAGKDDTVFAGISVVLIATGTDIASFIWSPGATLSCEQCTAPYANPRQTTTYYVTAISDKGCKSSDSVTLYIRCHNDQVFIPNTFTPNGDGQNDVFYPRGVGMKTITSFRIYNRWGELVFERHGFMLNDKSVGWDGSFKGVQLESDIFIYSVEGICDSGETVSWKGDVTLIR